MSRIRLLATSLLGLSTAIAVSRCGSASAPIHVTNQSVTAYFQEPVCVSRCGAGAAFITADAFLCGSACSFPINQSINQSLLFHIKELEIRHMVSVFFEANKNVVLTQDSRCRKVDGTCWCWYGSGKCGSGTRSGPGSSRTTFACVCGSCQYTSVSNKAGITGCGCGSGNFSIFLCTCPTGGCGSGLCTSFFIKTHLTFYRCGYGSSHLPGPPVGLARGCGSGTNNGFLRLCLVTNCVGRCGSRHRPGSHMVFSSFAIVYKLFSSAEWRILCR